MSQKLLAISQHNEEETTETTGIHKKVSKDFHSKAAEVKSQQTLWYKCHHILPEASKLPKTKQKLWIEFQRLTRHNLFGLGVDVEVAPQGLLENGFTEPKLGRVDLGEGILDETGSCNKLNPIVKFRCGAQNKSGRTAVYCDQFAI